jgi:CheY-like chemotaxis protein
MALMSVVLVEDDEHKLDQLSAFLRATFPKVDVRVRRSFQSGLAEILDRPPSLVLLDMTLPTFDISDEEEGGRPRPYGGREILEHMDENEITCPAIVITQYDAFGTPENAITLSDLDMQLRNRFPNSYKGTVYYHAALESWKGELRFILDNLQKGG